MFNKLDLFGSSILLRFKGEHTYNTKFGSFFSLLIVGFISFRLFYIVKDVFQRTSPQVIYNERQVDNPAPFEVNRKTFPLAFGMQDPISYESYIDESVYTITALWQQKKLVMNEQTQILENVWVHEILKIQPCTPENFGNPANEQYYLKLNYQKMYCFPPDLARVIQGDFNSDVYSEVKFLIMKCTVNCKPEAEMKYYLDKATFAVQISDVFIDPSQKSEPFQYFSQNLYWDTSTQLPKDVNIFLRNNYVYSDFGWITEDIITQSFPSYSFADTSYYPESYQSNYFISVLFRMEKQKEAVYQRKYQNLNNIISEIGGFTQSLLAIGILICTRVSQLHLNQEIINQAFNYEDSSNQKEVSDDDCKSNNIKLPQIPSNQLVDPNGSSKHIQILNPKINFSSSVPQRPQMNENLIQLSYVKYGESCNVSMQQDANMIPNSQLQSFNKNNNNRIQSPQTTTTTQQQAVRQQAVVGRDNKQILNYLIQENQQKNQNITPPEIIDQSTPQEERIQKLKQKIQEEEMKLKENRFNQLMEKQTKSMKMSVWEYCKSIVWPFGSLKEKQQIINYSIDKLYYNLDIFTIVKRLIEVEKLKRLLLDQDQIKLFNYLPKPTIHSDQVLKQKKDSSSFQYEIDILYQDNRTEIEKVKDAFQAYKKIINKQSNTILDQKIINLLDPNLIEIFETQSKAQQGQAQISNFASQKLQYAKEDSPVGYTPKYQHAEINSELMVGQEISLSRNQDKLLLNEALSPRMQIQPQPILQLNNGGHQEKSTQRSSDSSFKQQQQIKNYDIQQQLKEMDNSEIALEEVNQQPQEIFKSKLPRIDREN